MAPGGPRLAGRLHLLEVHGYDALEHRLRIEHAAKPAEEGESLPDELTGVNELRLAVDVVERELLACVVQGPRQVFERDRLRGGPA